MYGQYSKYATSERTKRDMLVDAECQAGSQTAEGNVLWSRKAGKNRLHFKTADGRQCFMLHKTIIAELSADGNSITLNDGGWATMVTRRAWGDAASAFGLRFLNVWGGSPKSDHALQNGVRFDRTITLATVDYMPVNGRDAVDVPMIRAFEDGSHDGQRLTVEYRGGEIISSGGVRHKISPTMLCFVIHRLIDLARSVRNGGNGRSEELLVGYWFEPGRFGRTVSVGCHVFETRDMRAMLRRLTLEHPVEAKKAQARFRKWAKARTKAAQ